MSHRICSSQPNFFFLFFYNLVEWKQYFLWFNKILFESSKNFGSLNKMVWLDELYLFFLVKLNYLWSRKNENFCKNVLKHFYFKVQYCYETNTIFSWMSQRICSSQPNLFFCCFSTIWLSGSNISFDSTKFYLIQAKILAHWKKCFQSRKKRKFFKNFIKQFYFKIQYKIKPLPSHVIKM